MKKILPILIILGLVGTYFFFNSKKAQPTFTDAQADLVFFWGVGCPHCEKVKEYINSNNLESKLKIAYKEVYNDRSNQLLLEETVKKCPEIDTSRGIGVPLAYSNSENKCFYGDTPIIDWLKSKQ